MKASLILAGVTMATFITLAVAAGDPKPTTCDTLCTQSALLRIGMNLEVSERVRKGDIDGALRLLNTMNVLEITPLLQASDEQSSVEMKRRVFRKLSAERSRLPAPKTEDKEAAQLNRDIDEYLGRYK